MRSCGLVAQSHRVSIIEGQALLLSFRPLSDMLEEALAVVGALEVLSIVLVSARHCD